VVFKIRKQKKKSQKVMEMWCE